MSTIEILTNGQLCLVLILTNGECLEPSGGWKKFKIGEQK